MVTHNNTVCPPDFGGIIADTVVSGGVPVTRYRFADPRLAGYAVTVVLDTVQPGSVVRVSGDNPGRIVTMVGRFPRCVLSEFNTHRVFSRNSASSRARSVKSVLAGVLEEPYVPVFTENRPGVMLRLMRFCVSCWGRGSMIPWIRWGTWGCIIVTSISRKVVCPYISRM